MPEIDLNQLKIDRTPAEPGTGGRRRRLGRLLLAAACLLLVGAALLIYLRRPVPVETATVTQLYPAQTLTLLNASGYIVAQRKAAVASKTTGRLEWLGVEEGSRVRPGQILARLDNREALAQRNQARANLAVARAAQLQAAAEGDDARANYRRMQELVAQGFVSSAEGDAAEARSRRAAAGLTLAAATVQEAEAVLQGAEVALDNTLLRSPFAAVVLTKNADIGDIVTPIGAAAEAKAAVVTIADLDSLQVEADVAESNLAAISTGQPCEILLDALPGDRFPGELQTIVPTADRSKATVLVKVRFQHLDPRILPEMSARVAFLSRALAPTEIHPKTAVVPSAISQRDGRQVVFRIEGKRVRQVPVTTGEPLGSLLEIRSGIVAGDQVVARPPARLRDGSRIDTAGP